MPMKITEAEEIVHKALGDDWMVVTLSGIWHIYPPKGDTPGIRGRSRSLDRAIEQAQASR